MNMYLERNDGRIFVEIVASVTGMPGCGTVDLSIVDLSIQGGRIIAGDITNIIPGKMLDIRLPIGGERKGLDCVAEIRWCREDPVKGSILGVSFDDEATQEALRAFLYRRESRDRSRSAKQHRLNRKRPSTMRHL